VLLGGGYQVVSANVYNPSWFHGRMVPCLCHEILSTSVRYEEDNKISHSINLKGWWSGKTA
jgi:hypothetical protein